MDAREFQFDDDGYPIEPEKDGRRLASTQVQPDPKASTVEPKNSVDDLEELYMGEEGEDLAAICTDMFVRSNPDIFDNPEEDAAWANW